MPAHLHFEQGESRAVAVVRPAAVEQVGRSLHTIERDHVLAEDLGIDDIRVWTNQLSIGNNGQRTGWEVLTDYTVSPIEYSPARDGQR